MTRDHKIRILTHHLKGQAQQQARLRLLIHPDDITTAFAARLAGLRRKGIIKPLALARRRPR